MCNLSFLFRPSDFCASSNSVIFAYTLTFLHQKLAILLVSCDFSESAIHFRFDPRIFEIPISLPIAHHNSFDLTIFVPIAQNFSLDLLEFVRGLPHF